MSTKIYFTVLLSATLFFGCESKENEKETAYQNRISELEAREQELQHQVQEKDAAFTSFMESVADIDRNLKEIRTREMNIEMTRQEEDLSTEDLIKRINEDIVVIDRLISENKQAVRNLNVRLRRSHQENEQLNTAMVKLKEDLNAKIKEQEHSLALLKDQLNDVQATVKTLHADVDRLTRLNEEKTVALNTAYYVIGNYKELKDEQILNKEGGFLGILGRVEMLRDDFNRNKFTRIDIREQVSFPAEGKKVELVTVHPPDSYKIEEDGGDKVNLIVSDPDKFWESSKYLVMVVNK